MSGAQSVAWAATGGSAALFVLLLVRGRLPGRLFVDALAIGLTLGAATAVALAPFELRTNPLHFAPLTLAFLFAGLSEEGIKLLGVAAFLRSHYLARGRSDVLFAAGALSLGFASLEDVFYLANAGSEWAPLAFERALTAMPFHVFLGLAGGFVIAGAPKGLRGVALILAAWLGLATIHGAYDFAVFAGAPGASGVERWRRMVAAFGWDWALVLRAMLAGAEAVAAAVGVAAILARRHCSESPRSRFGRLLLSRGLGWLVGGPLALAATLALLFGAVAALAVESGDLFLRASVHSVMPLALGVALAASPAQPASTLAKRGFAAAGALTALGALVAASLWGPAEWRELKASRYELQGARAAARGDYAGAVESYGSALAIEPDQIEALAQRAAAYAELNRYDAALADLDAAIRKAPATVALYIQRADINRRRNDPAASARDLDLALKLRPDDPELLALRAQARLETGDAKAARDDLAAAARTAQDNAVVRRTLAAVDVDAGDLDDALRQLNDALHAEPADAVAAFQRGRIWLYKGEPGRARADFLRADQPNFLYPALWGFLADAQFKHDGAVDLRGRLTAAPTAWPAPVARMLIGQLGHEAARAVAANDGERCEADFYFAMSKLPGDAPDVSASRFRTVLNECPRGFIEYEGAKAELRRIAP